MTITAKEEEQIYRVLDANVNRTKEGLRVLEEVLRFVMNDASLSSRIKDARHAIGNTVETYFDLLRLTLCRDTESDVGRNTYIHSEGKRKEIKDVLMANMRRVQEGLRVLEEFSKLFSVDAGLEFKNLRYDVYILEKDILSKMN